MEWVRRMRTIAILRGEDRGLCCCLSTEAKASDGSQQTTYIDMTSSRAHVTAAVSQSAICQCEHCGCVHWLLMDPGDA